MAPQTQYLTTAKASARLWESGEAEADPFVALQKWQGSARKSSATSTS